MFHILHTPGWEAETISSDHIYSCAATGVHGGALLLSHFDNDDDAAPRDVRIDFSGFQSENGVQVHWHLLDKTHDMTLAKQELYSGESFSSFVTMENFTTIPIRLKNDTLYK